MNVNLACLFTSTERGTHSGDVHMRRLHEHVKREWIMQITLAQIFIHTGISVSDIQWSALIGFLHDNELLDLCRVLFLYDERSAEPHLRLLKILHPQML